LVGLSRSTVALIAVMPPGCDAVQRIVRATKSVEQPDATQGQHDHEDDRRDIGTIPGIIVGSLI
jgi:hypothetical protein